MRRKLYNLINPMNSKSVASEIYRILMILIVLASMVPLMAKKYTKTMALIDNITLGVFVLDYIFRFITADYHLGKGFKSFLIYPFTFFALIDLVSIVPSIAYYFDEVQIFRVLRVLRILRIFRVLRIAKIFRYSNAMATIGTIIKMQRKPLVAIGFLACFYIFFIAMIMFTVEPNTFQTFFDAIYWATMTLTTVGYGDIYPVTTVGKIISMISSVIGIALVALPAGIITAGYMEHVKLNNSQIKKIKNQEVKNEKL
ncbi:MAG: ion transporter [Sphaerochaetaceae bacterium]|nr:ion transporter [Sphaerochaetaceae bacterium]